MGNPIAYIFKTLFSPVLLCSFIIPLIMHFCYKFLKANFIEKSEEHWIRNVLQAEGFDVIINHSVHMILLFASSLIFAVQYFTICVTILEKHYLSETFFANDWVSLLNLGIWIFFGCMIAFTFKNSFAEKEVLERYRSRIESNSFIPPNNIITWCRGAIIILSILCNIWNDKFNI
jgi:hypothetical protein